MFVTVNSFDRLPYSLPNLLANDDVTFDQYSQDVEDRELPKAIGGYFYDSFIDALLTFPPYNPIINTIINNQYAYGNDVWKALTVTLGVNPVAGVDWELIESNNRWLVLKNGTKYDYNKRKFRWLGMEQLVTPLVYAEWLRDRAQRVSDTGVVEPKAENSASNDPSQLIFKASLDYSTKLADMLHYLRSIPTVFNDLFTVDDYTDFETYLNEEFNTCVVDNDIDL